MKNHTCRIHVCTNLVKIKKVKLHSNTAGSCLNRIRISSCWLNLLLFFRMIICQDAARVRTLQRKQQVWLFWHTWLRCFDKWIDLDHKLCRTLPSVVCRYQAKMNLNSLLTKRREFKCQACLWFAFSNPSLKCFGWCLLLSWWSRYVWVLVRGWFALCEQVCTGLKMWL